MFEQSFIDAVAAKVADIVVARINKPSVEQRYMTVEEAAEYSGYSKDALYKHISRGHLPVSKQGTSTRIDKLEIDKWMARNRQ